MLLKVGQQSTCVAMAQGHESRQATRPGGTGIGQKRQGRTSTTTRPDPTGQADHKTRPDLTGQATSTRPDPTGQGTSTSTRPDGAGHQHQRQHQTRPAGAGRSPDPSRPDGAGHQHQHQRRTRRGRPITRPDPTRRGRPPAPDPTRRGRAPAPAPAPDPARRGRPITRRARPQPRRAEKPARGCFCSTKPRESVAHGAVLRQSRGTGRENQPSRLAPRAPRADDETRPAA